MGQTCSVGPVHFKGPEVSFVAAGKTLFPGGTGGLPSEFLAVRPVGSQPGRKYLEPNLPINVDRFQISSNQKEEANASPVRLGWRSLYALGPILGDGVSAKVYEAEALTPLANVRHTGLSAMVFGACGGSHNCLVERGRRVAIKRFHRLGSRTFKKELSALLRVGVHPHVLRLLESFEGCDGEDVLVLEYCDGSTVYDLYAREHPHGGLPERLIARLVRQLLLALEHLCACDVEHQDVKPENMMLHDVSLANAQAELKLGDFGWALVLPPPGQRSNIRPPSTGAGSLWYAPPELNPPVQGITKSPEAAGDASSLRGRSDMWSVGVVVYLLLVGHNPFNAALKLQTAEAVDTEVLRLAALGQFNRKSERWLRLGTDARDFVGSLLRVKACARLSATEALHHPYLTRRATKTGESSVFFHGPVSNWADRDAAWGQLDGFQRLAWLAVARAVAEPELDRQAITAALEGVRSHRQNGAAGQRSPRQMSCQYLFQLAQEMGTAPVAQWLQERSAWSELLRLAFSYLDLDSDGVLGPQDLVCHLASQAPVAIIEEPADAGAVVHSDAWATASRWVSRWQHSDALATATAMGDLGANCDHAGVALAGFRVALLASHYNDAMFEPFEASLESTLGLFSDEDPPVSQPSFTHVMAGPHDHEEEEITWTDLMSRGV